MNTKPALRIFNILLVAATAVAIMVSLAVCLDKLWDKRHTSELGGWYYMLDGEKISVTLPAAIERDGDLTLYNELDDESVQGITTMAAEYRINVFADGRQVYAYDDNGFERNAQMRRRIDCVADVPENVDGCELSIVYEDVNGGVFNIPAVYAGSLNAILRYMLMRNIFVLSISGLMIMLSGASFSLYLYLLTRGIKDRRILDCSGFLLIAFLWCVCASSIGIISFDRSPLLCYLSYYSYMLVIVPVIHFINHTEGMSEYIGLRALPCVFYANVAIQGLLDTLGVSNLTRMNVFTHIIFFVGFAIVVYYLIKHQRKTASKDSAFIFIAFLAVAGTGIIGIAMYRVFGFSSYIELFAAAVVVFVLVLLYHIIGSAIDGYQYKEDAMAYRRLSREDAMTKLMNRRSFEEDLRELEKSVKDKKQNAALFLLDLNELKKTNDNYGHEAGDELIMGAAMCIGLAVKDIGKSYRIGGDEFAVLILNEPEINAKKFSDAMKYEIWRYNSIHQNRISIASGMSLLLDERGSVKRFSDWKQEADERMYAEKELMHRDARKHGLLETQTGAADT